MKLTAIVLVGKNDLTKARRAIESVSFADEIIVVKEKLPVEDFSKARNRALESAKGEWVLFVDSDEVVSEKLRNEILYRFRIESGMTGYKLKRRDRFLGKWLRYGETAGVRLLRLARKDSGKWMRPVHEVWKINGRVGEFKNSLLHYSHDSIGGLVKKLDRYSEIEAEYRVSRSLARWQEFARSLSTFSAGWRIRDGLRRQLAYFANLPTSLTLLTRNSIKLTNLIQLIFFPFTKFIQNYIFRFGFLDGMEGFIHAGMMSGHSFMVRAKMLSRMDANKFKRMNANKRMIK